MLQFDPGDVPGDGSVDRRFSLRIRNKPAVPSETSKALRTVRIVVYRGTSLIRNRSPP